MEGVVRASLGVAVVKIEVSVATPRTGLPGSPGWPDALIRLTTYPPSRQSLPGRLVGLVRVEYTSGPGPAGR